MRLNLYLVRQIVTAMVFIVVSLTCVIWLSQSLRFVDLIVNRGLPIHTFIYLTVMLMPTWLSIVLPIASFASVLFVYNKMTADREMVVMSAAGLSPLRLAQPALIVAVGTTALCFLMTAYLMPMSYRGFKELQWQIRHNFENLILREGEAFGAPAARPPRDLVDLVKVLKDFQRMQALDPDAQAALLAKRARGKRDATVAAASSRRFAVMRRGPAAPPPPSTRCQSASCSTPTTEAGSRPG